MATSLIPQQKILIIGAFGQTSLSLVNRLNSRSNFEIYGVIKNSISLMRSNPRMRGYKEVYTIDMSDSDQAFSLLNNLNPNSIFHFAGVHGGRNDLGGIENTHSQEMHSCHVDITRNILEWQSNNLESTSHFALSAKMFSPIDKFTLISEHSKIAPQSLYGKTKADAWHLIVQARETHGIKSNGYIFFNHASTYTKPGFFARDIADKLLRVSVNQSVSIEIEDSLIDISCADDVCKAIEMCHDLDIVGDFVLGSGKLERISSILKKTLNQIELDVENSILFSKRDENNLVSDIQKIGMFTNWTPSCHISNVISKIYLETLGKQT